MVDPPLHTDSWYEPTHYNYTAMPEASAYDCYLSPTQCTMSVCYYYWLFVPGIFILGLFIYVTLRNGISKIYKDIVKMGQALASLTIALAHYAVVLFGFPKRVYEYCRGRRSTLRRVNSGYYTHV